MPSNAPAPEALPCEPLLLPPLFRSEGFAEDLPDLPVPSSPPRTADRSGWQLTAGAWLGTAPLVVGLISAAASVLA